MARPQKSTVDYFPHFTNHGKTLFILEGEFGNDGYAFWFKLLEALGTQDGHFIDCRDVPTWRFLLARTRIEEDKATSMLDLLSSLGAIDSELWEQKIIYSGNFVSNVSDAYKKRKATIPTREHVLTSCNLEFPERKPSETGVSGTGNPQIKGNEIKGNEIKGNNPPISPKGDGGEGFLVEGVDSVMLDKVKEWYVDTFRDLMPSKTVMDQLERYVADHDLETIREAFVAASSGKAKTLHFVTARLDKILHAAEEPPRLCNSRQQVRGPGGVVW